MSPSIFSSCSAYFPVSCSRRILLLLFIPFALYYPLQLLVSFSPIHSSDRFLSFQYPSDSAVSSLPLSVTSCSFSDSASFLSFYSSHTSIRHVRRSARYSSAVYRLLFLFSSSLYHTMMDRNYFHQIPAASRHPNLHVAVRTERSNDWNSQQNISKNIERIFGSVDYFHGIYLLGEWSRHGLADFHLQSPHTILIQREHECWEYRCVARFISGQTNLIFLAYGYEIIEYHLEYSATRLFVHMPNAADPYIFNPMLRYAANRSAARPPIRGDFPSDYQLPYQLLDVRKESQPIRNIDFLVVGAVNSAYPIRQRVRQFILDHRLPGNNVIFSHPGYYMAHSNATEREQFVLEYSHLLHSARFVLCDSSYNQYFLQKYAEITMSGAVCIGDLPYEFGDLLKTHMIVLNSSMSDEEMIQIIGRAINGERATPAQPTPSDDWQQRSVSGMSIAFEHYSWDRMADVLVEGIARYLAGNRGLYLPFSMEFDCPPHVHGVNRFCARGRPVDRRLRDCNCVMNNSVLGEVVKSQNFSLLRWESVRVPNGVVLAEGGDTPLYGEKDLLRTYPVPMRFCECKFAWQNNDADAAPMKRWFVYPSELIDGLRKSVQYQLNET